MVKVDHTSIFPTNKVKAQIRSEENIGKIYTTAVEKVGAASAIFIENMVHQALKGSEKSSSKDIEGEAKNGSACRNDNVVGSNILTKDKLEALLQNEEYKFLTVNIDQTNLSKYNKVGRKSQSKKKAESSAGRQPKKKQKVTKNNMEKDVASVLLGESKGTSNDDATFGLNLEDLAKSEVRFDGIIEDDEDYD